MQTTNSELVQRLKTTGRDRSKGDAHHQRELETNQRNLTVSENKIIALERVEKHLKNQLREMATANSELLARLNAHAATSATSRLEARTIRQEAEGLQEKMLQALRDNEHNLDQSVEMENQLSTHESNIANYQSQVLVLTNRLNDCLESRTVAEEQVER